MPFDLEAARKAGATDGQIASFLAQTRGYDLEGARKAGATDAQLAEYLAANTERPKIAEEKPATRKQWGRNVDPPEGGIYQGNPAWKQTVHDVANATLPWGTAAAADVGGTLLGANPVTGALAAGTGYATGKKAVGAVDRLIGFQEPPPRTPDTPLRAMGRTVKDVGTGTVLSATGSATGAAISKGLGWAAEGFPIRAREWGPTVDNAFKKAVRPSVEGKRTFGQMQGYLGNARSAVESIIRNKEGLRLTGEGGEVVTGQLPKNLRQFSEALEQTKGTIYRAYDEMARSANGKGASISLEPIAQAVLKDAESPAMQTMSPGTVRYAQAAAKRLSQQKQFSASEAQEAIRIANESLNAYYKNPSPATASRAGVDVVVANRLRAALDEAIETAEGPGYQALKNRYGALKAVEKDVNHRAVIDERKNVKGLLDFTDVFSAAEVIKGLVSGNPATVATGLGAKAVAALYKAKNNPNNVVRAMFTQADRVMTRNAAREAALAAKVPKVAPPTLALPAPSGAIPMRQTPSDVPRLPAPTGMSLGVPYKAPEGMAMRVAPRIEAQEAGTEAVWPHTTPVPRREAPWPTGRAAQSAAVFNRAFAANKSPEARSFLQSYLSAAEKIWPEARAKGLGWMPQGKSAKESAATLLKAMWDNQSPQARTAILQKLGKQEADFLNDLMAGEFTEASSGLVGKRR